MDHQPHVLHKVAHVLPLNYWDRSTILPRDFRKPRIRYDHKEDWYISCVSQPSEGKGAAGGSLVCPVDSNHRFKNLYEPSSFLGISDDENVPRLHVGARRCAPSRLEYSLNVLLWYRVFFEGTTTSPSFHYFKEIDWCSYHNASSFG